MDYLVVGLYLSSAYVLWRCWQENRGTSLIYAVIWTIFAWVAWGGVLVNQIFDGNDFSSLILYLALSLSGCAGIAVLGARRPGDKAWNFVVGGLLAILLLPIAEGWGQLNLTASRIVFLTVILSAIGLNYIPTRLGLAALVFLFGCISTILTQLEESAKRADLNASFGHVGVGLVGASPWLAFLLALPKRKQRSPFDRQWLDFRDRFGMIWALRVKDQFNRSAKNLQWPVQLRWSGLSAHDNWDPDQAIPTLYGLLKRFGKVGST